MVERRRQLCSDEGLDERISFLVGDACATDLPAEAANFVWGEDAWCYVSDKPALIAEAARLLRPGGVVDEVTRVLGFPHRSPGPSGSRSRPQSHLV